MKLIFNNKIYHVSPYNCYYNSKFPLFIYITNICNARCEYCANNNCNKNDGKFDFNELKSFLDEHSSSIYRVSISGGEPLLDIKRLKKLLKLIKKYNLSVSLHTNGYFLVKYIKVLNRFKIDSIMISRHHYEDDLNNRIFKLKTLSFADMINLKSKNKIEISCLLVKGYIDSIEKVKEYLERLSVSNIKYVGFISMLQINDFTRNNFIDYRDIISNLGSGFREVNKMRDGNRCSCATYLYMAKNNKTMVVYFKYTKESSLKGRSLLYDYNGLQEGYYSQADSLDK